MKAWHIGELSPCIISRLKVTEQHHSEDEVQNGTLGTFELLLVLLPKLLYISHKMRFFLNVINHRFLTIETNLKAFCCLFSTSSVKLFIVNVQIFVYSCVFRKKEKQHSQNL